MPNLQFGVLELAALAWLAYAGYRLWTATASPTARWVGLGFVVLAFLWLGLNALGSRADMQAGLGPLQAFTRLGFCIECQGSLEEGRKRFRAGWMAGALIIQTRENQPYALDYKDGQVWLQQNRLEPGCTTGYIHEVVTLEINGVSDLVLEVGPGATCRN